METAKFPLPVRGRGRPTQEQSERYQKELEAWCGNIKQLRSSSDFSYSSRGWCYVLEDHGLLKSQFDLVEDVINDCRKNGMLPIDICSPDESRGFSNIETIAINTTDEEAEEWVYYIENNVGHSYTPFSFWDKQEYYVQMLVEKIDPRKLFEPICASFYIPIANAKGWPDINVRAEMMERYKFWEERGKKVVLLYLGDHDPAGLHISDSYYNMLAELSKAVGWGPDNLIIDRFGLNEEFIKKAKLSWIPNLITGAKKEKGKINDLADPRHPDHDKPYVQNYIKAFGVKKVESNAIVVAKEQGKKLCLNAIKKYISEDTVREYRQIISTYQNEVKNKVLIGLREHFDAEQQT